MTAYIHITPELEAGIHQAETGHKITLAEAPDGQCAAMCHGCYWMCATNDETLKRIEDDYRKA